MTGCFGKPVADASDSENLSRARSVSDGLTIGARQNCRFRYNCNRAGFGVGQNTLVLAATISEQTDVGHFSE